MKTLSKIPKLIKLPLIILSTFSSATGFYLAKPEFTLRMLLFTVSLMILAAGSASLNQYQDRNYDAKMDRTKNRPIPAGDMSPRFVLIFSISLIAAGIISIGFFFGVFPMILGILTVILYNGIYTYLKRITPLSVFPGALVGALPPAIGWFSSGGEYFSAGLIGLMLFFFIWQIPHFWLLLEIYSSEYRKAGFPVAEKIINKLLFTKLIFIWIIAMICSGLLLRFYGLYSHLISITIIIGFSLWIAIISIPLMRDRVLKKAFFLRVFKNINVFALLLMLIIFSERGVL